MWWQLLRTACSRSIRAPLRFFRQTSLLEGTSAETWNTLESTAKLGSASPAICRIPGGPVTDTEGNDIHILWNEHLMSTCTGTLQFHASLVLHYIYIYILIAMIESWAICETHYFVEGQGEVQCPKASHIYIRIKVCPTSCTDKTWTTFAYFCTMPDHAKDFSSWLCWLASWSKPFHLHPWGDYSPSASLRHVPTMC